MNRIVDAVIFDLDGTLTDTEKYYQVAWPQALEKFGYEVMPGMTLELRSLGRPFAIEWFKKLYGNDFDYSAVREYRKELIEEMIKEGGIPLKPGAKEILDWLRNNNILTALATANEYERTSKYLNKIGLFDSFDRIVCANMVKEGKPSPAIYKYACSELGLLPSNTFAVEDSPNGIKSAYGAGCKTIMIPDLSEPDDEIKPMLYTRLDNLLEIKKLFND